MPSQGVGPSWKCNTDRCGHTDELQQDFAVMGFAAPCVVVRRKSDRVVGSLLFQHMPRFYFRFVPD